SIPVAQTNVVTLLVISGSLSIPALESLIVRGWAPQLRLAEKQHHDPKASRVESIDVHWRRLTQDLGRPPVRMPRRS
ncbi:hypothetical protein, partial [Mycobacterium intermedium]